MLHEFLVTEIRGIQSWIDLTLHFRIDFSLLFHLMNSQVTQIFEICYLLTVYGFDCALA